MQIIDFKLLTPEEAANSQLPSLGVVDPFLLTDQHKEVLQALMVIVYAGKCFVPGTYVLTDGYEREFIITLNHTIAIKETRHGNYSCKFLNLHQVEAEGSTVKIISPLGKVISRYDENPGLRFELHTSKTIFRKKDGDKNLYANLYRAMTEYNQMKPILHLKAGKPLAGFDGHGGTFTLSPVARMPGDELFTLITNDAAFLWNKNNGRFSMLTLADRFEITIALFTALRDQVFKYNKIHRDIKPENIFVYKSATGWKAFILDYDYSIENGQQDGQAKGTPLYFAPEILARHAEQGSDIYSMAETACFLWHDAENLALQDKSDRAVLAARRATINDNKICCLHLLDQRELSSLLNDCRKPNVAERPTIDECIERAEAAYRAYQQLQDKDLIKYDGLIKNSLFLAKQACSGIFAKRRTKTAGKKERLNKVLEELFQRIDEIHGDEYSVSAFAKGLGFDCCAHAKDKATLKLALEVTKDNFLSEYNKLADKYDRLQKIWQHLNDRADKEGDELEDAIYNYLLYIDKYMTSIINTPLDFNAIEQATKSLQRKNARVSKAEDYFSGEMQRLSEVQQVVDTDVEMVDAPGVNSSR